MRIWTRRVAAVGAGAVALVLLAPQVAVAASTLAEREIAFHTGTHGIWYEEFDFATTQATWSAVAVYAPTRWPATLVGTSPSWVWLASTGANTPVDTTQFIAVNSRLRPLGSYRLQVTRNTGPEVYVQWRQADYEITLPTPANDGVDGPGDPDLAFATKGNGDIVRIGELYLEAGEKFWANAIPRTTFFLLTPTTAAVARAAAVVPGTLTSALCTLYTAPTTGVYGVVVVSNDPPNTTAGGTGIALHRFDPARPITCPQRNFPDPTPPGL